MLTLGGVMRYSISVAFSVSFVLLVSQFACLEEVKVEELRSAAGVIAQISATLAGFLLAVLSILATIANTRLLRNMQKTGHYAFLLHRLFVDAGIFGVAVALGVVTMLAGPVLPLMYLLIFVSVLGLMMLIDAAMKLWVVLSHLHPEGSV